jgi:hypothetical protein
MRHSESRYGSELFGAVRIRRFIMNTDPDFSLALKNDLYILAPHSTVFQVRTILIFASMM